MKKPIYLIAFVFVCMLAGVIGSLFTAQSVQEWYPTLVKPDFTPPSWVFGPVWTTLYILMGLSAYLVSVSESMKRMPALKIFSLQLALNVLWSIAFFGLRFPVLGLLAIVALWIAILWTMLRFYEISKNAAYLMVPYIIWVSFAAVLNLSLFLLNP